MKSTLSILIIILIPSSLTAAEIINSDNLDSSSAFNKIVEFHKNLENGSVEEGVKKIMGSSTFRVGG